MTEAERTSSEVCDQTVVGPTATRLLFENDDAAVWLMDVGPGESFWPHYHHHDYVLYYLTDTRAIAEQATKDEDALWAERFASADEGVGILTRARSFYCIPADGFLSPGFDNIGSTRMLATLIECKRVGEPVVFASSEAFVGVAPEPGTVELFANHRFAVHETVVPVGEKFAIEQANDAAVFRLEGGIASGTWRRAGLHEIAASNGGYREIRMDLPND